MISQTFLTVHEEPEVIETQGETKQIIKKKKVIKKVTKKGVYTENKTKDLF